MIYTYIYICTYMIDIKIFHMLRFGCQNGICHHGPSELSDGTAPVRVVGGAPSVGVSYPAAAGSVDVGRGGSLEWWVFHYKFTSILGENPLFLETHKKKHIFFQDMVEAKKRFFLLNLGLQPPFKTSTFKGWSIWALGFLFYIFLLKSSVTLCKL